MKTRSVTTFPIRSVADISPDTQFILKQLRMLLRTVEGHEWHFRNPPDPCSKTPDTKYIAAYLTSGIESILSIYRMR
ncbi:MAG: hypothetical protein ACI4UV_05585 [Victivallales bacterium]